LGLKVSNPTGKKRWSAREKIHQSISLIIRHILSALIAPKKGSFRIELSKEGEKWERQKFSFQEGIC